MRVARLRPMHLVTLFVGLALLAVGCSQSDDAAPRGDSALAVDCSQSDAAAAGGDGAAVPCTDSPPGYVCPSTWCDFCGPDPCPLKPVCASGGCFECEGGVWAFAPTSCDCWPGPDGSPDAPDGVPDAPAEAASDAACGAKVDGSTLPECPDIPCNTCPLDHACFDACAAEGCLRCVHGAWLQEAWDCSCPEGGSG